MKLSRKFSLFIYIQALIFLSGENNIVSAEDDDSDILAEIMAEAAAKVEKAMAGEAKIKVESETVEADIPEVQKPEPDIPEPETPEVKYSEPETAEVKIHEPETPEVKIPEPETPEVKIPEPETPEVKIPEPETPEVKIPEPETPKVEILEPETPEAEIPVVEIPPMESSNEGSSKTATTESAEAEAETDDAAVKESVAFGFSSIVKRGNDIIESVKNIQPGQTKKLVAGAVGVFGLSQVAGWTAAKGNAVDAVVAKKK